MNTHRLYRAHRTLPDATLLERLLARTKLRHRPAGQGFTLVELLVVVSIIALLMALVLPVTSAALARARTTACNSNHRQLGQAMAGYLADNNDEFPYKMWKQRGGVYNSVLWVDRLMPYLGGLNDPYLRDVDPKEYRAKRYGFLRCPEVRTEHSLIADYGINVHVSGHDDNQMKSPIKSTFVKKAGETVLICDAMDGTLDDDTGFWYIDAEAYSAGGSPEHPPSPRHRNDAIVMLFCDGHVEAVDGKLFETDHPESAENREEFFGDDFFN